MGTHAGIILYTVLPLKVRTRYRLHYLIRATTASTAASGVLRIQNLSMYHDEKFILCVQSRSLFF